MLCYCILNPSPNRNTISNPNQASGSQGKLVSYYVIVSPTLALTEIQSLNLTNLKPENFLFSSKKEDAVIKIIDFGLSRHDTATKIMYTKVGTPYYVAPEGKYDVCYVG